MIHPIKRNWRKLAPGAVISITSLVIVFFLIDLDRFYEALRLADYRYVALLFVITLFWLGVRGIVWRTLLKEQPTYGQVFLTLNEGYLINNILPFRLGEIGRALLLSKKADLSFFQVFSTILVERALDLVFAAGLLLMTAPFVVRTGLDWQVAGITGGLVLLGLGLLHLAARRQDWALQQFERVAGRLPFLQKILGHAQIRAFFSGLDALTNPRRFMKVILFMLLNWSIAVLQFHVLLLAFFPDARLLWGAFTLGVMALGIAAPSSPGAIGVMEISIVAALSAFGLDPSTSLAAALTAHLSNYLTTGLIGSYALAKDGLSLSGLFKDVSQITPSANENPG